MKTTWSRTEILGKRLFWLVEIEFAGAAIRLSTETLVVSSDDGDLRFEGRADDITVGEEVSLFALTASPLSVTLNANWPVDVPALVAQGHQLAGCRATLCQWVEGSDYEDRRFVIVGRLVDPSYDREGLVSCSIEQNLYDDATTIPDPEWIVTEDAFGDIVGAGLLASEDENLPYPIIIGYPGRDPQYYSGWVPGSAGCWITKAVESQHLLLGAGHYGTSGTSQVWLVNNDYIAGEPVIIRHGHDDNGVPVTYINDDSGGSYSAGYEGLDEGGTMDSSFFPDVDTNTVIWVGWETTGGVLGKRGTVVRSAGEVMEYVLDLSTAPIDRGAFAAAAPLLGAYKIDCVVDDHVSAWEWVTEQLLPLLPVSLVSGPNGYAPIVWRHEATAADAVAHIDADADPRIDVETVEYDNSEILNDFTLRYGLNRRTNNHRYVARLSAAYVAPTNHARARFVEDVGSLAVNNIYVSALQAGEAGAGIRVQFTAAGALNVTDNATTKTVTLEFIDGASTTQAIVNEFQTSTLVTAVESSDTTAWDAGDIEDADQALYLVDNAILPHPLCALSRKRLAREGENDDGVRTEEISTHLVGDKATAYAILNWKAAAFALPRRRITMLVPENEWGWLGRGAVVTFSCSDLGFSYQTALVEGVEWGSDGMLGIRLAFIEDPDKDGFVA